MIPGYRRHHLVANDPSNIHLAGYIIPWPGASLTAECLPNVMRAGNRWESAPAEKHVELQREAREHLGMMEPPCGALHSCGIYMVPEREDLVDAARAFGNVEVQVMGWGRVAEYAKGWRVEHARILHIWLLTQYMSDGDSDRVAEIASALKVRYASLVTIDDGEREDLRSNGWEPWWGP